MKQSLRSKIFGYASLRINEDGSRKEASLWDYFRRDVRVRFYAKAIVDEFRLAYLKLLGKELAGEFNLLRPLKVTRSCTSKSLTLHRFGKGSMLDFKALDQLGTPCNPVKINDWSITPYDDTFNPTVKWEGGVILIPNIK